MHDLSQFMEAPHQAHFDADVRVLRYLIAHPCQGLFLRAHNDLQLYSYCDVAWATCMSHYSHIYYRILCNAWFFTYRLEDSKATYVSRSSVEAEYRCMALVYTEVK